MNKLPQNTIFAALVFLLTVNVQAANTPIVRDGNMDGGARIMQIHCPSAKRTTVRLYVQEYKQYRPGMTCVYKKDGDDICRDGWDIDEAASEACAQIDS